MSFDKTKDVEKYILLGYKPKRGLSIEKNIQVLGHQVTGVALLGLIAFNLLFFVVSNMNLVLYNLVIFSIIPIVIFLSVRFNYLGIKLNASKKARSRKGNPYVGLISIFSGVAGITFARLFITNMSENATTFFISVIVGFLFLILVFLGCIQYHQVYLIRKYCPYLMDR